MSRQLTEWTPGAAAPVLDAALVARIHELNLAYVHLLCGEAQHGAGAQIAHLPRSVALQLAGLPPRAREALAGARYTLYSLGFEDEAFWRSALHETPAPNATSPDAQSEFCELAILLAWHVGNANPGAAPLVYAMARETQQRLAAAPLARVRAIAREQPQLLSPRWPTNPSFWPDLVRFAAVHDAARLRTSHSLGHQLIAAELNCGAGRHAPTMRPLLRLLGSPRLRARKRVDVRLR